MAGFFILFPAKNRDEFADVELRKKFMKNNVFSEMNILTKMLCVFYFLPFLVHVYSVRLIKKCNENRFSEAKDDIIQAYFLITIYVTV